jgi:hypothetical protein
MNDGGRLVPLAFESLVLSDIVIPNIMLTPQSRPGAWRSQRARPLAVALLLIAAQATTATAMVRITDDHGGNVGPYLSRYLALRDAGEQIVIDGTCSSACTLVLGILPHHRICVTANAVLGFHAARRPGLFGATVINDPGTRALWNIYPSSIRQWINRHGGLGPTTIYLSGPELFAMYRQCRRLRRSIGSSSTSSVGDHRASCFVDRILKGAKGR